MRRLPGGEAKIESLRLNRTPVFIWPETKSEKLTELTLAKQGCQARTRSGAFYPGVHDQVVLHPCALIRQPLTMLTLLLLGLHKWRKQIDRKRENRGRVVFAGDLFDRLEKPEL